MSNKKLRIMVLGILITIFSINTLSVFATASTTYVSLTDTTITVDNNKISTNNEEDIYLTTSMNNGGTSEDATNANIEIDNVINIQKAGTYEFTGTLTDGQISVNSNDIKGDVIIILNNANITCENAPAIFVYNKSTKQGDCNVIIKTAENSTNVISGGKIKQSVEGWKDQDSIIYYVEKDYNDENEYYERYKYDGAISSDISLTFEGNGNLIVNALKKEGIETKRDITINSGSIVINSLDDGINAAADNESVITINGGDILVNVQEDAEEGDGIDSNGYIYINGGNVYAYASYKSQDSGLDSDLGIYINGGYVVGTGNMADSISKDSKQAYMQMSFKEKVQKDTLITITDKNKTPLTAFMTDREYTVLTISVPEFTNDTKYVYEAGEVEGTNQNGLYTNITSYTLGTEKEYSESMERPNGLMGMANNNKVYYYVGGISFVILVLLFVLTIILRKKNKGGKLEKVMNLFIGIFIGIFITTLGFMVYENVTVKNPMSNDMMDNKEMLNDNFNKETPPEKPDGNMQDAQNENVPEKPNGI